MLKATPQDLVEIAVVEEDDSAKDVAEHLRRSFEHCTGVHESRGEGLGRIFGQHAGVQDTGI